MSRFKAFPVNRLPLAAALSGALVLTLTGGAQAARDHRGPEFPISVAEAKNRAEAGFQEMDADGNGEISPAEWAAAPMARRFGLGGSHHHGKSHHKRHQLSDEQRAEWREKREARREAFDEEMNESLFSRLDEDGDGQLSRAEFDTTKMREARRAAMHERVFARLDDDDSGGLSRDELPDMSRWLEAMDTDGDGTVTREEARAHHGDRREARRERQAEQS